MRTNYPDNINRIFTLLLIGFFFLGIFHMAYALVDPGAGSMVTIAESSGFTRTSLYDDVISFIFSAQQLSPGQVQVIKLTTSTEGRLVPLIVISKDGIKSPDELVLSGKPAVLIMANIHAGEIEGKEASLMLLRDFSEGKNLEWLENQVILLIPILNPDGNDKLGDNRYDNGPGKAGVRYNGQFLDLNRDYIKLESPEIRAIVRLMNQWDPVLVVDMHTTNGSYHREPVTYTAQNNPDKDPKLSDYLWKKLFPAVTQQLKEKYGFDSVPYGNFVDRLKPEKGWENDAFLARFGTNYLGLRNRFAILDENYSHADFKTRVLSSYAFIKAIVEYTNQHAGELQQMVITSDTETRLNYCNEKFPLEFEVLQLFDITIQSYVFKIEKIKPEDKDKYPPWIKDYNAKKTDELKDYQLPYFSKASPTRTISLPKAYIILPFQDHVIENLKLHGIIVETIRHSITLPVDKFKFSGLKTSSILNQGHVEILVNGNYETHTVEIPAGSYYISMKQPLARLIPVLLEPGSQDSLLLWGFFNRRLVSQWSQSLLDYPVYRLHQENIAIERFQE